MKSPQKKNQEKTTRSVAHHVSAKEKPLAIAPSVIPTGNSTQLIALSNHAANQTTNWNQTVQMVAGWIFDRLVPVNAHLVKLQFKNTTNGQICLVHHHPGTDYVTALDDEKGNRLGDSTLKYDADLASAAMSHLVANPIQSRLSKAQDVPKSEPVDEEKSKALYKALAAKATAGKADSKTFVARGQPKPPTKMEEPPK